MFFFLAFYPPGGPDETQLLIRPLSGQTVFANDEI
jgi:hypothetical protein